ncbi:MAG: TetR/AcrR family transcriptional regulator [Pseudomonadota bacterium]
MARGRAAGYDDQREAILQHAAALFARSGYPATSMNQVAEACGLSKATLYHYYRDKDAMLVAIAEGHVLRLQALVDAVLAEGLPPERRLRTLIRRIVEEYAGAQHAHRVLTEDVRFLAPADRQRVLDTERQVVAGFAQAVAELRPGLQQARLDKPLTMLLFGMINWLFTWMRTDGPLDYDRMALIVADLFVGGIAAVQATPTSRTTPIANAPPTPRSPP